jgi:peroxiredoxin
MDPQRRPQGTPQTEDDNAYDHLRPGTRVPEIRLPSTNGDTVDVVADAGLTVLFLYPATGVPGRPLPEGWLQTPGAYGCTGEACAFRDLAAELTAAGAAVRGVSTQAPAEQAEFARREQIGYPLLSDAHGDLTRALALPTFRVGDSPPRIKRATLLVGRDRRIRRCFYPIPDPSAHPTDVLAAVQSAA